MENKTSLFYNSDCSFFRGDIPCKPHKEFGVKCESCNYYNPKQDIILIIKLGAIGDVIRTSPLLYKLWDKYPKSNIWWLTYYPDVVSSKVDKILNFSLESLTILNTVNFSLIINLDKDPQACALASTLKADEKLGFTLINGKPAPIDSKAQEKYNTGLFDDVNKANKKSYLEEIFEICGWQFENQEYILEFDTNINWNIGNNGKKIIGLNTGCGDRWVSRLWADENWIELIKMLQSSGYYPLLLGGKQEDEKNKYFADQTGASYLGYFSLKEFISLVAKTDLVVSAVTMGMHIATALQKPLILMNNIFNPNEFELYGRGEIVQPSKECHCFFSPKCTNDEYKCMEHLSVKSIFDAINRSI